ncbi:glycine--tRNA ligase, chloroplastic/mitochondrial 2 isoform X2 [Nymphaea colorata]|uniref:glycine--tRNA ligase, chloroplastic/mitochondrial 2 isoform X2 n=1 Tax=Nymphaea colorata TaxID=210225 RepID=UPI00129D983A|nr:glycine--tRNA ligase, chloroplastic/mitochondrial 2 isoform X2 [Nymphaea colorata]
MAILSLPKGLCSLRPRTPRFSFLRSTSATTDVPFILFPSHCLRPCFFHSTRGVSVSVARTISSDSSLSSLSSQKDDNSKSLAFTAPTFQQAIQRLQDYWASVGCAIMQCSNTEVGAGTMNPLTFLRVLGPEPWNVAYVEPSIRPDDSRYGDNPNRLQRHTQFQVILKPDPGNSQELYIRSLSALGINVKEHDIRFVEDNWESPVLGAWGLGWEVWMDGMEITQFTYFQQAGSIPLMPVSVEITYGLERILMLLQGVDHFKKIQYAADITYGELFLENEKEMSAYYLERASVDHIQRHFEFFEEEARALLSQGLAIPAYDQLLKTSHSFNILDARGFVGVTERARYFGRMRSLARHCAQLWVKTRESLGFPLGSVSEPKILADPKEIIQAEMEKVSRDSRGFILEVGTEEMPPQDVTDAGQQLKNLLVELLEKQRLNHGEVSMFGTPRRIVVQVDRVSSTQYETELEVRGPPVEKAFDMKGNPTKAAEGFCRRYGVPLDAVFRKTDGKSTYLYVKTREPVRNAFEVLAESLPNIISSISFPKSMRWSSQVMFSRPIRWILALHGDVLVPFVYAGILSGKVSHGLRNSPSATVKIDYAEEYPTTLMKAGILVKTEERKRKIVESSRSLAESVNGSLLLKESLLDEVVNLVEAPLPILGSFDESFLELPRDLLVMVMQKHQRYFAIEDLTSGKLLPFFIAVANGVIDENVVRKGNEAVLRARYEDAKFFYNMDRQKRLTEFRDQLKGILFHEKLGTVLDKTRRIQETVPKLGTFLGLDEGVLPIVQDAASLAMADLATSVVTEFTSLSGIMARHYALHDGYSEQIAEALYEIVLPRFSGDIVPKTDPGIVLAVADRLDSLVGLFAVGCQPTSSNDPFGLRRISYGLVQVLVENKKNLDLRNALQLVADVQPVQVGYDVLHEVHYFVTRRLEQLLVDSGVSAEVVRSVLSERANWPYLAAKTAKRMEDLSREGHLQKIVEAYSRPTRILRGKDVDHDVKVETSRFGSKEEHALWVALQAVEAKIHGEIEIDDFVEISSVLLQPLEDFFNNVFVMVDDEGVRKNRLALLKRIANLPRGIADLTVLPGF